MDQLLNTMPCGFVVFSDDGRIIMTNATLRQMLGDDARELDGENITSIFSVGGRIFYQTHLFPMLKLHGRIDEVYLSLRSCSGDDIPVLANAVRQERDGAMLNECALMAVPQRSRYEDEILQAKRAAEAASQARTNFLSMISHELRTPLHAIAGYVELLREGIHGELNQTQLDDLAHIDDAGTYLLTLINDILNYSRLEAEPADVQLKPTPVDTVLSRAESLILLRAREAGVEYQRRQCESMTVYADTDRLQQILLNLLSNAIKFTEAGGHVDVQCEQSKGQVLLHVCDTGRGIASDAIERIFDPFVQLERDKTESRHQGIGLGLAISRGLARAMGGDLTVESTPGKGSRFTVRLKGSD